MANDDFWANDITAENTPAASGGDFWLSDQPAEQADTAPDTGDETQRLAARYPAPKEVPPTTAGSVARDIASGVLQIGPTAVKGAASIVRMATGDRLGKDTYDAMERGQRAIQDTVGSERGQMQRAQFASDMANEKVGLGDALLNNKGAIADQVLPTIGSMLLPVGVAGAAGKVAGTLGKSVPAAQKAASIGSSVAMNAGETFSSIRDKGGELDQAYTGAAITAPFSYVAGRLSGGGAEALAARKLAGEAGASGVRGVASGIAKSTVGEAGQEAGEETGNYLGETIGTGDELSANQAAKQVGVAAVLGGVMGGSVGAMPQRPADRAPQIKALRERGDETAAAILEKRQQKEQASYAAEVEAGALADFGQDLQARYRETRMTGAGAGDAVVHTVTRFNFEQAAQMAGLSPKAQQTIADALTGIAPEKAPGFVQKAITGLVDAGMAQPFEGMDTLAQTIETQRDQMLDSVLGAMDAINQLEGQQDATEATTQGPGQTGEAVDAAAAPGTGDSAAAVPGGDEPGIEAALSEEWQQFPQETGTLNIPRAEMPQVKTAHRGAMVNFLGARGVTAEQVEVDPADLKPTQAEFSQTKVQEAADRDTDRSILISSDGHIIDGHHQAIAKLQNGKPVRAIRLGATAQELIPLVREFPSSTVDQATDVQDAPQGTTQGTQAQAAAGQAPAPVGGNAAAAGGVPATRDANAVVPDGLIVTFGGKSYPVKSIREAQEKWIRFRETAGAGVSDVGNGVQITDAAGQFVARVSYNGRAWASKDQPGQPDVLISEAPDVDLTQPMGEAEEVKAPALPKPATPGGGGVQADGIAVSQPKPETKPEPSNDAPPVSQQDPEQQRREHMAAERKRAEKRARLTRAEWEKNPLREFLGRHGVSMDLAKEFAPGTKERRKAMVAGHGPIFRKAGKNIDMLAEAAAEEGFTATEDADALYELIGKVFRGDRVAPLYAEGAAEAEMEARMRQSQEEPPEFGDFLGTAADDFLAPLTDDELSDSGYAGASDDIRAEVDALIAMAETMGIDTETLREDAARATADQSEQAYYEQAKRVLAQAIEAGAGSRGDGATVQPGEGQRAEAQQQGAGDRSPADGGQGQQGAPDALSLTPRQFHAARLQAIADDTGTPLAEVKEFYDDEGGRKESDRIWVEAIKTAFKNGDEISAKTLDKLEELRPGAFASFLHDNPEAKVPAGYQTPDARKTEQEQADAKRKDRADAKARRAGEAGTPTLESNPDGTLAVTGDKKALRERLTAAGIPGRSILPTDTGVLVGKTQAQRARNVLEGREADKNAPRTLDENGRATDGLPINAGDVFTTLSGRQTTPYPKQKGERYASQWLIDNAIAEAKQRGDDFNATGFGAEKPMKDGSLPTASRESMLMYLFGEQPAVAPSILKPLTGEKPAASARQPIAEDVLEDLGLLRMVGGRWKYKFSIDGGFFTANSKEDAVERATDAYYKAPADQRLTSAQRAEKADAELIKEMDRTYGDMSLAELRQRYERIGGDIASLQSAGSGEFNGNGGRRTRAATSNEAARAAGEERLRLGIYIKHRESIEKPVLTAPTRADIEAQQDRTEQADKLDAREQIKRESEVGDSTFMTGFTGDGRQDTTAPLFSRSAKPVRNLVAMHNLTDANLLYADSMGGIPVPSIGITKIETPFSRFGDITMIAPASMVDPADGVPVFDRDAWTARFPSMNFKKVRAKVADAFYERMQPAREYPDGGHFISMLWESVKNASVQSPDKVARQFDSFTAPLVMYAKEVLGKDIKVPMRAARLSNDFSADPQLLAYWKKNGTKINRMQQDMSGPDFYATPEMREFSDEVKSAIGRAWSGDEKNERSLENLRGMYIKEMFGKDGLLYPTDFNKMVRDFARVGTKEIDTQKLSEAVRKIVNASDPGYQRWVKSLVEPLFEEPTITLRGKEVRPTLDNIVESMTIGATQGAEKSLTFGPGKTAAMLGKRYKSMDAIKADRDRIVSQAQEGEGKKATETLLDEYRARVTGFFTQKDWRGNIDTWAANDASMEALARAGKAGGSDSDIRQALSRTGFRSVDGTTVDLAKQSIAALRNAATDYFEAKPQRAVKLSEFRGAVIPKGASQEVKDALTKNGVEFIEYNKKTEGARDAAIQKLAKRLDKAEQDVMFNRPMTADLFRQMTAPIKLGMDAAAVQQAIAPVLKRWTNGPKVNVVATTGDLPVAAPSDVHGMYLKGSVYLVAQNIRTPGDAMTVLAHEAVAHHGMRDMLGVDGFKAFMNQIQLALKTGNKPLAAIRQTVRAAYVDESGKFNLTPGQEADEIAAKVVEQAIDADGNFRPGFGFVKSVYAKIVDFLRSIGLDVKMTHAELQGALLNAQKHLEKGSRTAGARNAVEPVFSREDQTQTEAFRKWFGDSKVVTPDGLPLVVYHGTNKDVAKFKPGRGGGAIWFAADSKLANLFVAGGRRSMGDAAKKGSAVYPVHLSIQKPLDLGRTAPQDNLSVADVLRTAGMPADDAALRAIAQANLNSGYAFVSPSISDPAGHLAGQYSRSGMRASTTLDDPGLMAALQAAGFDGLKMREEGSDTYAVFRPEQIKSAIGNAGTFDPNDPDIRFSRTARTPAALNAEQAIEQPTVQTEMFQPGFWDVPQETRLDKVIYELADGRIDLKRVQETITKSNSIPEKFDARLAETLYPGRVATRADRFLNDEAKPLLDAMARNNVTMDELSDYLQARHAEERNKQIAKVNPDLPDGGAGKNSKGVLMTTEAAKAHIARLSDAKRMVLAAMAKRVDTITQGTTKLLVEEGLEKQETIDAWTGAYKSYVPLFRDEAENGNPHPTGSGMSVRGSSSKRAVGSTRQATNILAHVLMQREAAITRAEKNRVAVALYGLALSNPNPDFWTTIKPSMAPKAIGQELQRMGVDPTVAEAGMQGVPTIRTVDPVLGRVVSRPNPIYKSLPGAIVLKVNGEDRVLMLNVNDARGLRMAESLKNLDGLTTIDFSIGLLHKFVSSKIPKNIAVGPATRWMASVNTQYNPAFGLVNLVRDTMGGAVNLTSTPLRGKSTKVLALTAPALKGIGLELSGKESGEWGRLFRQFQADGGQTGFRDLFKDANERSKQLEAELKAMEKAGTLSAEKVAGKVLGALDIFNTTLENGVRLAAYKSALDAGMSRAASARLARELTVDFNRKGRSGREVGPLYAFFNASVQGSARTLQTLAGPAGAKIVAGGLALGAMQALALLAAGYDDDEIPEFVKTRALIIPMGANDDGEKKHLAIPLPLGLHVLPNTGRVLAELALDGGRDAGRKAFEAAGEIAGAFNPLGGGNVFTADGALRTVAPTVVDPIIELGFNKNFAGTPIEREGYGNDPRPGFERAREGTLRAPTGQAYLEVSRILNALTGGDEFEAGVISPTPERVRYLAQVVGGGLLREIEKIVNTSVDLSQGNETKPTGYPVVGRFYGVTDDESVQRSRYYENLAAIEKAEKLVKAADKKGDFDAAMRIEQARPEATLSKEKNRAVRDIRELNQDAMATVDDRETLEYLDKDRTEVMRSLNTDMAEVDRARKDATLGAKIRRGLGLADAAR